eukprot:scaffold304994_cov18-Tisochrysis_lutea.AAC.1
MAYLWARPLRVDLCWWGAAARTACSAVGHTHNCNGDVRSVPPKIVECYTMSLLPRTSTAE